MRKNIVAIVTFYNPNESTVVENIKLLTESVNSVIIVDNTVDEDKIVKINNPSVIQIFNHENYGLSKAFNIALKLKIVEESDYIIFFDQDSAIKNDLISCLVEDYEKIERITKIGCIGPVYLETNSNKIISPRSKELITDNIYSVSTIITSSMLTTYENLKNIGFWNEQVFLDMADWDICWRFQKNGYLVAMTQNTCLIHTLGEKIIKLAFLTLRPGNPVREYYQIRDSKYLMKANYVPIKYRIRFVLMWTIAPLIYLIMSPDRKERRLFIKQGFIDYRQKKTGVFIKNDRL